MLIKKYFFKELHEVGTSSKRKIYSVTRNSTGYYQLVLAHFRGIENGGYTLTDLAYKNNFSQIEDLVFIAEKEKGFGIIEVSERENVRTRILVDFQYTILLKRFDKNIDAYKDGKWGVIDKYGKIVNPFESYFPIKGKCKIKDAKTGKIGLLSEDNEILVPTQYDDIEFSNKNNHCVVIKQDDFQKRGVYKYSDKEVVPCKYLDISFKEGVILCLLEETKCEYNLNHKIYEMYSQEGYFLTGGFSDVKFYDKGIKCFSYGDYVIPANMEIFTPARKETINTHLLVDKNWNSLISVNGYRYSLLGKSINVNKFIENNYDINYYYCYERQNGEKYVIDLPSNYLCGSVYTLIERYFEDDPYDQQIICFDYTPGHSEEYHLFFTESKEITDESFSDVETILNIDYCDEEEHQINANILKLAIVRKNEKYGLFNLEKKNLSLPCEYECFALLDNNSILAVKLIEDKQQDTMSMFADIFDYSNELSSLAKDIKMGEFRNFMVVNIDELLKKGVATEILKKNGISIQHELNLYPFHEFFADDKNSCYDDDYDDDFDLSWLGNSRYGGYNGYSDDVIDDVFDGDPEATWNID